MIKIHKWIQCILDVVYFTLQIKVKNEENKNKIKITIKKNISNKQS